MTTRDYRFTVVSTNGAGVDVARSYTDDLATADNLRSYHEAQAAANWLKGTGGHITVTVYEGVAGSTHPISYTDITIARRETG